MPPQGGWPSVTDRHQLLEGKPQESVAEMDDLPVHRAWCVQVRLASAFGKCFELRTDWTPCILWHPRLRSCELKVLCGSELWMLSGDERDWNDGAGKTLPPIVSGTLADVGFDHR